MLNRINNKIMRKILSLLAIVTLLAVSCIKEVAVTDVQLNKSVMNLQAGDTEKFTVKILPQDATNQTVTWKSSDPTVAAVDNGMVTAITEGVTTITVTTANGNKTATCEITVTEPLAENGDRWKYTNESDGVIIELTFYPDENKLHIKSTPEELPILYRFMLQGNRFTEYRMEGNIMYEPDMDGNFDGEFKDSFSWIITYPTENEMILKKGGYISGTYITSCHFIRQIN